MLFTAFFATPYQALTAVLLGVGIVLALVAGSFYFNHRIDQQEDSPNPTPVEYLVVIGVAYTLLGVLVVSWLAFVITAVAFAASGLPMLYGARRREGWRQAKAKAEEERAADVQRQALIRRAGGDDAV